MSKDGLVSHYKKSHFLFKVSLANVNKSAETTESVRIRSFSGPYFPAFGLNTERYGMRENTDQKNSDYGHFSRSD